MAGGLRKLCKEEPHVLYFFLRCYLGDQINEDEMGGGCGGVGNAGRVLVGKPKGKRLLGRTR